MNNAPILLTKGQPGDDYVISLFACLLGKTQDVHPFRNRYVFPPSTVFNDANGLEARNASSVWAGPDNRPTECPKANKWA
jgi:hypothetical protein